MPREDLPGPLRRSRSGSHQTDEKALERARPSSAVGVGGRSKTSTSGLAQAIARTQG